MRRHHHCHLQTYRKKMAQNQTLVLGGKWCC
ncbi:hypothetical protein Gotur_017061 [Gossypium turneri]